MTMYHDDNNTRATKNLSTLSTRGTTAVKDSCGELRLEMITGDFNGDHNDFENNHNNFDDDHNNWIILVILIILLKQVFHIGGLCRCLWRRGTSREGGVPPGDIIMIIMMIIIITSARLYYHDYHDDHDYPECQLVTKS